MSMRMVVARSSLAILLLAAACSDGGSADPVPDACTTCADAATDVAPPDDVVAPPRDVPAPPPDVPLAEDAAIDAVATDAAPLPLDVPLQPHPGGATYYRAGAAEAVVNPTGVVVMSGYGFCAGGIDKCRRSEGIHDDLHAVALAIEEASTGEFVVLVGLDSVGLMWPDVLDIQERFAAKVEAATGVPVPGDRVVVGCSHSHGTPDSVGIWGSNPDTTGRSPEYMEILLDGAASAAAAAYAALEDATLVYGRGWHDNAPDVDGMEMDGRVSVLRASRLDGSSIGSATIWGAHPTVYGSGQNGLTPDFAGTFRYRMAELAGGGVHAFLQGPVGGVYPIRDQGLCHDVNPFTTGYMDPDVSADAHAMAACVGFGLADAALAALEGATPLEEGPVAVRSSTFPVFVENAMYAALSMWGMIPREIPEPRLGLESESMHSWARIGQVQLVTMPGEGFPEYAKALRERLVAEGAAEDDVVAIGLGNDWMGYLMIPAQYDDASYAYQKSLSPARDVLPRQLEALEALLP